MKNVVNIKNNELLDKLEFSFSNESISIKKLIEENILDDYSKGIKFCDLKVFPSDFYWETSGSQAKSWANGDILDIGDIISVLDKNGENILYYDENKTQPYHFKVIDVKTIYEGQTLLELKLMECKFVYEI